MQHPVGYVMDAAGKMTLVDVRAYLLNPWALWEYAHTMTAAVVTSAFVVAAVAAYWSLMGLHEKHARAALRLGVVAALVACAMQLFPTGDRHGKLVAEHQPAALAAMEGKFQSSSRAELAIVGQPNVEERRLENPIIVPGALSFLAYGSFGATVVGLEDVPRDRWPDNVELLYFAYHVMVGLGTLFLALTGASTLLLIKDRLHRTRWVLWAWMLAFPFPYIATTAGWMTAELGRQPWVVYGLMRTAQGASPNVGTGDVVFTTLGYMGLYLLLGVLFVFLVGRQIVRGPEAKGAH